MDMGLRRDPGRGCGGGTFLSQGRVGQEGHGGEREVGVGWENNCVISMCMYISLKLCALVSQFYYVFLKS